MPPDTARTLALDPVDGPVSLKEHIYRVLRRSIIDLDVFHPEASLRLDERSLAEQLGISRTPVREALGRLEQEGFVETRARRGVFIRRPTLTETLERVTVWAALEGMAARLACERAGAAEIEALGAIALEYSRDAARVRLGDYAESNIAFHHAVLRLSGCAMLEEIAEGVFAHLKAVRRRALFDAARAEGSVAEHAAILEALSARDADRAERLVREHTLGLNDYLRRSWGRIAGASEETPTAP